MPLFVAPGSTTPASCRARIAMGCAASALSDACTTGERARQRGVGCGGARGVRGHARERTRTAASLKQKELTPVAPHAASERSLPTEFAGETERVPQGDEYGVVPSSSEPPPFDGPFRAMQPETAAQKSACSLLDAAVFCDTRRSVKEPSSLHTLLLPILHIYITKYSVYKILRMCI